jgi:dipeptidyl aminopeptidase/acylaminoacyl peptidase
MSTVADRSASDSGQTESSHPFTVHDLVAMDRLAEPQPSPDGALVAFVVSRLDLDANRRRSDLWVVGADGANLRRLTTHDDGVSSPRWTPDGRAILFLSNRSGSSQVWRIPVEGGESQPVTELPLDVGALLLTPDGTRMVIAMDVYPGTTPAETKQRETEEEERRRKGPDARLYDRLFVRHWDRWTDGRRSHLFVVPVAGGEPCDLMPNMDADCPHKPFGDSGEIAIHPDGGTLVFSARDAGREEAWSTRFDLFAVPLDGSSAPRNLTPDRLAWDTAPAFSPDGRSLAWLGMRVPGYEADRFRILVRSWPDGPTRVIAEPWDRSPQQLAWSRDGATIYATAPDLGRTGLFAIDVTSGEVRTLVAGGTCKQAAVSGDRIVFGLEHLRMPTELYSVGSDGGDLRALTSVNAARVAAVKMGEPEPFTFPGWNDETVHAWVVKPIDFDPPKRYPVAFLIHGGPQGSFPDHFHYRWNAQTYAAAGYAVVMVDFHGSTGYGQAFTDSIQGDWGGKPLEDLQKGLAAALARYSWMDEQRVAALGASYGGFMVAWIAGQWPDRFKCLVNHDGGMDERAGYFDTEELFFPEREYGGTPWEVPEAYDRHSPIRFVDRWKTPMLVIHGGRDFRVPETQGLMAFTALQRRGIPSRFLHFPGENHWVLKPRNSILWHETVLEWLAQWIDA